MDFSNRAVAFLDILGFKTLIAKVENLDTDATVQFTELLRILDNHVKYDNNQLQKNIPDEMLPKYLFISDSLIISAPESLDDYYGIAIVTLKAIEVAHKLLEIGLLVRGGIDVGSVWHDKYNIFGSGYVGAYQTEQQARHPCILLSKRASDKSKLLCSSSPLYDLSTLWLSESGKTIVNTLHPSYIVDLEKYGREEHAFQVYRSTIVNTLENMTTECSARNKWEWIAQFFNKAIKRHGVQSSPIKSFPFSE